MTFYERFEQVVALILGNVIAVVIVISLFQLDSRRGHIARWGGLPPARSRRVSGPVRHHHDPADRHGVQTLHHSRGLAPDSIIQVKTVVLPAG